MGLKNTLDLCITLLFRDKGTGLRDKEDRDEYLIAFSYFHIPIFRFSISIYLVPIFLSSTLFTYARTNTKILCWQKNILENYYFSYFDSYYHISGEWRKKMNEKYSLWENKFCLRSDANPMKVSVKYWEIW